MSSIAKKIACLCFLVTWLANANAQQPEPENSLPRLLTQTKCFGGLDASYDDWMAFLKAKNDPINYLRLRYQFPRSSYEHYQRSLDCRAITYRSDGHVVRGWLVQPKNRRGARLPIVIYNRDGDRGRYALTFAELFTHVFPLAERGYFVAASQYRGAIEIPGATTSPDQFGGDDVRDVTNLMSLVATFPEGDPDNFMMIGEGRGAIMVFRALQESPFPVRAAAIYSGIYDLHDLLHSRPETNDLFRELIPGFSRNAKIELDKRSVNRWVAQLPDETGLLVFHGEKDVEHPPLSAHEFAHQLAVLRRPHKAIFFEEVSHRLYDHNEEVNAQTLAWFHQFRHKPLPSGRLSVLDHRATAAHR